MTNIFNQKNILARGDSRRFAIVISAYIWPETIVCVVTKEPFQSQNFAQFTQLFL